MSRTVEKSWLDDVKIRVDHQERNRVKMATIRQNSMIDNEKELRSLDSTLKKTTSYMKKVKVLSAASVPSLIDELSKLNLTKFVEEMALAIIETKLKLSDIPKVADYCVAISARYSTFSEIIAGEFKKVLPLKRTDKIVNMAKLRVDIIFLAELILSGVFNEKEGLQVLGGVLSYLIQTDKTEFVNVGLLSTVCKSIGWQIAGIIPIPIGDELETVQITQNDVPTSSALTNEQKKTIRDLIVGYYDSLYKQTEKICTVRNKALKKVKRQERVRGDAGEQEKNELTTSQTELDANRKLVVELSSSLGIQMKPLKEEASDDEEDEAANLEMGRALAEGEIMLWADEETKAFYEDLINLRQMVPKSLYKDSEERTITNTSMAVDIDAVDMDNVNEFGEADAATLRKQRGNSIEKEMSPEQSHVNIESMWNEEKGGVSKWQSFVLDLDHLVSKYSTDQAANFFVSNLNNKNCRKKLVKLMVEPPPSRMDVLPFYSRLIATLENVMPDVTTEIVNQLLEKFRNFLQKGSTTEKVEVKLSCVIMIAELMKFKVISRAEGLSVLRQLVYDLRGHAVDMAATMMESGGLYLYRHTDSHAKMKRLLEVIKAKRDRMKDPRQIMLIDNSYYTCLPPEVSKEELARLRKDEEDTPMKQFIRHIILDINDKNVNDFLRCLRRLDWSSKEISDYAIKYMTSPWLLPLENLQHLASALAGLFNLSQLKWVGVVVVDAAVEIIRLSLEVPGMYNQWAVSAAVFLGELYSFALCEEELIFNILFLILEFPENENSWRDLHRIRTVCSILSTAGEFFQKGQSKTKMRYFLLYFHRHYFLKKETWEKELEKLTLSGAFDDVEKVSVHMKFPYEVEVAFNEVIKSFRRSKIGHDWPKNYEEACVDVEHVCSRLKKKLDSSLTVADSELFKPGSENLGAIVEEEEEEDDEFREQSDNEYSDEEEEDADVTLEHGSSATKEEEDEFQRELDRLMGDSFRTSSAAQNTTNYDMTIPSSIRNRFERSIRFAEDTKEAPESAKATDAFISLANERSESIDSDTCASGKPKSSRVTLMTRGKGNKPSLKTVNIEDDGMREKWRLEREKEEEERADMKRLTLGQHRRIEMEEEMAAMNQLHMKMKYKKRKN